MRLIDAEELMTKAFEEDKSVVVCWLPYTFSKWVDQTTNEKEQSND